MVYNFENLILDLNNSARAKLYKDKQLVFIGDGYIALKMFLKDSEYHPDVMKKFKNQLEQREKYKWKEPKVNGSNRLQDNGS